MMIKNNQQTINNIQTNIEQLSIKLEKHIIHKNIQHITQQIQTALMKHHISYKTYQKCKDLIGQIQHKQSNKMQNQFSMMLQQSTSMYQRTSQIFKQRTLRSRFVHLLKKSNFHVQKNTKLLSLNRQFQEQLTLIEKKELQQVRRLYHKYKVSNMFRKNILIRFKKNNIEKLILKGYLEENKPGIISLVC